MYKREQFEWCNYWWEEAADTKNPRVLVIGDSITAGYRPFVNDLLKETALVDMYASSRSINDRSYFKELEHALSEYPYRVIHFNNGLHGIHLSIDEYCSNLIKIIFLIQSKQPAARIILATSTPVTLAGHPDEQDEGMNRIICERNQIVIETAATHHLPVDELYAAMLGKSDIRMEDGYHYNEKGKAIQAEIVAFVIKGAM